MKLRLLTGVALLALLSPAQARHHHYYHHVVKAAPVCGWFSCFFKPVIQAPIAVTHAVYREAARVVGGRPSGCPHAFCGCGTSLHIFGRIIPELNLASNWRRFPSAAPGPGMVAYRSGHVFAIESVNADGSVVAYDSNSGGGLTRIHNVSLRGYHVVNPHAGNWKGPT
jgi:hypothetical protein